VFKWSIDDGKIWTKCYNIVCKDALNYDYEFDQGIKQENATKKKLTF